MLAPHDGSDCEARSTEDRNNARANSFECTGCQPPRLHPNQSLVSREEFSGPGKAGHSQPTVGKIVRRDGDRPVVSIRIAGHLAENPISPPNTCQDNRRAEFCLREVREGERHQRYRTSPKCDHAASSSGRFQSSARARSLSKESSCSCGNGSSSRMVTKARCARDNCNGSESRTCPFSSTVASTVRIIPRL